MYYVVCTYVGVLIICTYAYVCTYVHTTYVCTYVRMYVLLLLLFNLFTSIQLDVNPEL